MSLQDAPYLAAGLPAQRKMLRSPTRLLLLRPGNQWSQTGVLPPRLSPLTRETACQNQALNVTREETGAVAYVELLAQAVGDPAALTSWNPGGQRVPQLRLPASSAPILSQC